MPELVQALGALAGLAAVAGWTVLSALWVSQARDVERLRRWAGGVPAWPSRPRSSPIGIRHLAVAGVGLLVFAGATAYGVTWMTGGDGGDTRAPRRSKPKRATIKPGNVTVAVLNGTTVPGLAARLRDEIGAAGFRGGTIDVFSDQRLAESVVQYAPGHQAEAKAVGRGVGISRRAPVTADSRALAGDATVIVVAGADKGP